MIRVAEHVARTDTGHQRATNEDSYLERSPVFVVADGMGGAQAGEVASHLAVTHFSDGLPGDERDGPQERLARAVREANAEIHALSENDPRRAGMGTTLTAAYVGPAEVSIAHVGDSRAYRLRAGTLERITEDHSLVEELLRQGRLTEEEAEEHPQRSIITRALGPEPDVEVDTVSVAAADGDVYLLCSDGLTSMVAEGVLGEILRAAPGIASAADSLVAAALDAGGRDNVTVVLFRVETVDGGGDLPPTQELTAVGAAVEMPAVEAVKEQDPLAGSPSARVRARAPRMPPRRRRQPRRPGPRRRRRLIGAGVAAAVIAVLVVAGLLATQAVYFIGTDANGQVTVYNGVPYTLPGGGAMYSTYFVSGVTVAELSPLERGRLFNNQLRSEASATRLVDQLELDRITGQDR
jgi:PPM family protein phosphatase